MNLNPEENPTPGIDEALLDEALAQPTPAELEAKILELTDPQMLSLLDEALAPDQASDALTQRILAATTGQTPTVSPAVVARIGPSVFRYAAAAAIVLAVGLGVYFINQGPDDTNPSVADNNDTPGNVDDPSDTTATDDIDWLTNEQFATTDSLFEATTGWIEAELDDAASSLDTATITRDTLWSELDAYEQFLDEFES